MPRALALMLALSACGLLAAAQDSDSDGLPDPIEVSLGSDPDRSEQFQLILDDRTRAAGDKTVRQFQHAPDVSQVWLANVAQDRWLFKITFAKPYATTPNTFILYLDVDNDLATGRQDKGSNRGTDLMYVQINGKFSLAEHAKGLRHGPNKMAVVGDTLYVCDDIKFVQPDGRPRVRFKVLSHVSPPNASDADYSDWKIVRAPAPRQADKPRVGPPPPLAPPAKLTTDRPDADSDGVPDDVELRLGMSPTTPEAFVLMRDDKAVGHGDKDHRELKIAPDITRVCYANVAGNRYVWRLEFAKDFVAQGTVLILYMDCDNRLDTGRQDHSLGTDVMLTCVNGGFGPSIRNPRVATTNRRLRGVIDGSVVYFCMDLLLHHTRAGHAEYRATVLSHRRPETRDADNTPWFTVHGPGESDRPKPRTGVLSEFRSKNLAVEEPWLGWRRDLTAMEAVTVDPAACTVEGFARKDRAFVGPAAAGLVRFRPGKTGRWHIGVALTDDRTSEEELELRVNGRPVATLVAAQNDARLCLFVTRAAIQLDANTTIEIAGRNLTRECKISEIILTRQRPRPRPLQISHLTTWCPPQTGDSLDVHVCWTTNLPSLGQVQWGPGSALDHSAEETADPGHNHRVVLSGMRRDQAYSLAVTTGQGRDACRSQVVGFTAAPARVGKCGVRRARVALSVAEPGSLSRPAWPVATGVPLPRAALSGVNKCRLLDGRGRPVHGGLRAISHWPDGSVKWVLVSAVTPLDTAGASRFVLEYGEDVGRPAVPDPIRVQPTGDGLRVTNGPLQVTLSKRSFVPPGRVVYDRDHDGEFETDELMLMGAGGGPVLRDGEGREFRAAGEPAARLEVEEAGPCRTVVVAEGRFSDGKGHRLMSYRCRLYFHRGFPGVPMVFTLLNDEGRATMPPTLTDIQDLRWPLKPMLGALQQLHGPEGIDAKQASPLRVLQDYEGHTVITAGSSRREADGRPLGGADVVGERGSFAVAMRYFWQTYPKAITVGRGEVVLELLPELPKEQYAQHDSIAERTRHYFWCHEGRYRLPMGAAIAHEVLAYFGDAPGTDVARWWEREPFLAAEPEHYCASGAFMDLSPERPDVFPSWAAYVDRGIERQQERRDRRSEYDFFSFGDWYGERAYNWGNLEYDFAWGALVHFARTADARFVPWAVEPSRHMAAIDVINAAANPYNLGRVHVHCLAHTGGYHPKRIEGAKFWFNHGGHDVGHTWTQGMYGAYCLTGDRRYLESADLVAAWLSRHYTRDFYPWVHRNYGWATLAVLGGYHATANPYYLNAARLFTEYTLAKQDPGTGHWPHPIGECTCESRCMGGKAFMTGVGLSALKMMDQIEPDPHVKHALVRGCDWLHHRMWHPGDNSFQYAECTNFDKSSTHAGTYMLCEPLAYAYEMTKKPVFKEMLLRSLADMATRGPSGSGKGYAMQIRMVPFALHTLAKLGVTRLPTPPPPSPAVAFGGPVTVADGVAAFAPMVHNPGAQPIAVAVKVTASPPGITVEPGTITWNAPAGRSTGPVLHVKGAPGPRSHIDLTFRSGKTRGKATVPLRTPASVAFGQGLAYVGAADDPLGRALRAIGVTLPAVEDVRGDGLSRYAALIIGCEAHEKNHGHLKDAPWRLLEFVHAGGRAAIVQLQDTSYQVQYLPYPLAVSNDSSAFGKLATAEHPIFHSPGPVKSLAGAISYDTVVQADQAWSVLATDQGGQPSVLECRYGKGAMLVIQASMDRYVCGEVQPEGTLTVEACRQFLRNLVAYMKSPE